jgi:hypothetical protein
MLTIKNHSHDYSVETFASLGKVFEGLADTRGPYYLVDCEIQRIYQKEVDAAVPENRKIVIQATEEKKSYERLAPIFLELLSKGLKRDGTLIVVGGGVLQDIGCFIATVLFRGVRWEYVPTTLLAQSDSCIGSKSSINIGEYKNQIGTFCPPHRVMVASKVLSSLPWDEIRSGLGEVIKLQLIAGQAGFDELMADLKNLNPGGGMEIIPKWVERSLAVKKPYIEEDEFEQIVEYFLNQNNQEDALDAAIIAVDQFPYSSTLVLMKADVLLTLRRYEETLEVLEKAELLNPNEISIYIIKTDALLATDQQELAAEVLESAINLFEGQEKIELLFELSDVYDDYENFDKVFECLKMIIEIDCENEEALYKICFWSDYTGRNEESIHLHNAYSILKD